MSIPHEIKAKNTFQQNLEKLKKGQPVKATELMASMGIKVISFD